MPDMTGWTNEQIVQYLLDNPIDFNPDIEGIQSFDGSTFESIVDLPDGLDEMLEDVTAFNESGGIAGAISRNVGTPRNTQPVEAEPNPRDNTMLYVGIGLAVLLLTKR